MTNKNNDKIDNLFHYTSLESAKMIIESCSLKTSKSSDFNDPFECLPCIKELNEYPQDELQKLTSGMKPNIENAGQIFRTLTDQAYRFISCGATGNIPAMWAHYAKNHTGVLFEFNLNSEPLQSLHDGKAIRKISYSPERIKTDILNLLYNFEIPDAKVRVSEEIQNILTTKNDCWKYENEIRIMVPILNAEKESFGGLLFKHDNTYFIRLLQNSIKSVFCGMNMQDADFEILQRLVQSTFPGNNISVQKVYPSKSTYGFHPFSPK